MDVIASASLEMEVAKVSIVLAFLSRLDDSALSDCSNDSTNFLFKFSSSSAA